MKNIIILLFSLFIISCSSDSNSTSENTEGTILKSYKVLDTNPGDTSTEIEHFFENNGSRYEKIMSPGSIFMKFNYDSNNKMTKIIISPDSNPTTISFTYNDKGQIIKMEKDTRNPGVTGKLTIWLYTYEDNIVTGELVSDADPILYHTKVRYTFNNDGLLVSRHDYKEYTNINKPISTIKYTTLTYDTNKNLITLKISENGTHDLPDSPANLYAYSINYKYDDKINPIHKVYMNHYLNYILSNEYPFVLERGSFQDRVTGTGSNNLIKTTYPVGQFGGIPVDNVYINSYNYQSNNLPKRMGRVSTADNKEYSNIIYNYINN